MQKLYLDTLEVSPSLDVFFVASDMLSRHPNPSKENVYVACVWLAGELIADYIEIENLDRAGEILTKTISELQGVFDTCNVQNYIYRLSLPFKDELDELAALFVILGLNKNDILTAASCAYIVSFKNNYSLENNPYSISLNECIPLILLCRERAKDLDEHPRLNHGLSALKTWRFASKQDLVINSLYVHKVKKYPQNRAKYTLLEKIGEGGFGSVFKATGQFHDDVMKRDLLMEGPYKRTFAVKVVEYYGMGLTPKNSSWNELNILSQYTHENIIEMYDFWIDDENISFVLEFAEQTLYDVILYRKEKKYCR